MSLIFQEASVIQYEAKDLSDRTRRNWIEAFCKQTEKSRSGSIAQWRMAKHKVNDDIRKVRAIDAIRFAEGINNGMELTHEETRTLVSEFETVDEMLDELEAMPRRLFDPLARVADKTLRISTIIPWVFTPVMAREDQGFVRLMDVITRFAKLLADIPLFGAAKFQSPEHRFLYLLPTIAVVTHAIPFPVSPIKRQAIQKFLEDMALLIGNDGISHCLEVRLAALSALTDSKWQRYDQALSIAASMASFPQTFLSALMVGKSANQTPK